MMKYLFLKLKNLKKLDSGSVFRWNLLLMPLLWAIVFLPFTIFIFEGSWPKYALIFALTVLSFSWLILLFNADRSLNQLESEKNRYDEDAEQKLLLLPNAKKPEHLVVMTVYREPLSVIEKSLVSLSKQSIAHEINMVVGFEERTPNLNSKILRLQKKFQKDFKNFLVTIHPAGIPGEIPGKCSNVNYATRAAVKLLQLDHKSVKGNVIVTTCDADNLFHPNHFEGLSKDFLHAENRYEAVWQGPLVYDWNLDSSNFFTRNTGMLRSVFMMGGLIPFNINTMSIQTVSLKLLIEGDFYQPDYQMEDILNVSRWMTKLKKQVEIRQAPFGILSGPTSGVDFKEELKEWYLQAKRWTIGSGEVFHYFLKEGKGIPLVNRLSWIGAFVFYYIFLMVGAPLMTVLLGILNFAQPMVFNESVVLGLSLSDWISFHGILQLGAILISHLMNRRWVSLVEGAENKSQVQRIYDWITTPLTIVSYAAIGFYALHLLMVYGRQVCGHEPSSKSGLDQHEVLSELSGQKLPTSA